MEGGGPQVSAWTCSVSALSCSGMVDPLSQVSVLPQQFGLVLAEFLSVFRRRLSFALSVRVCAFWAMMTSAPV